MKRPARKVIILITVMMFACVSVLSYAATCKPAKVDCKAAIDWQIAEQAKITSFACEVGTFKKKTALIFTVSIKNITKEAQRYRLNIFLLDQDKAAGHLIPRKGKPPVVKPGETATVKVPFFNANTASKDLLVVLKTIE